MPHPLAIHLTPRAEHELTGAFEWYEGERSGLWFAFLDAVAAALSLLMRTPAIGRVVSQSVHRYLLRRFRYGLFYGVEGDALLVIVVVHAHRHPRLWPQTLHG